MKGIYDNHKRSWLDICEGLPCVFWSPMVNLKNRRVTYCFRAYKKCGLSPKKSENE